MKNFIKLLFFKIKRYFLFKKKLKELKKRDPFIYR